MATPDYAEEIKRWWFVLHDSEEALRMLEDKWDNIQMQTGWKLESLTPSLVSRPSPLLASVHCARAGHTENGEGLG